MKEVSLTSDPKNLKDLRSVTFSQALEAGLTHSGWLAGRMTGPCGQDPALVSHSVLPERVEASRMNATSGPLFGGSYPSAGLQLCLASRLQARMDGSGCPEYEMTWKSWDMTQGPPICALRASGHRTSGNGCFGVESGWPTVAATEARQGYQDRSDPTKKGSQESLSTVAVNALTGPGRSGGRAGMESCGVCLPGGWATPRSGKTTDEDPESWAKRNEAGKVATMPLTTQAQMAAGWKTPMAATNNEAAHGSTSTDYSRSVEVAMGLRETPNGQKLLQAAGFPTARTSEGAEREVMRNKGPSVSAQAQMAGFPTPHSRANAGGEYSDPEKAIARLKNQDRNNDLNEAAFLFAMPDMTGWKLNPAFSLWLMGYPAAWLWNAPRGTVRGNADLSTVVPLCLEPETR